MREYEPYKDLPAGQVDLHLRSTDFADGASLPETATGAGTRPLGADKNPQLSWDKAPEGTKSLLISCYDPDAPTPSGYWHWVAINVDPETTSIAAGGSNDMPEGTVTLKNDGGAPISREQLHPRGMAHTAIFSRFLRWIPFLSWTVKHAPQSRISFPVHTC